jgi:methionyl-tRNA formyltransferase
MFRPVSRLVYTARRLNPRSLRQFHAATRLSIDEKLRILFCGADRFSVAHLEALHNESKSADSNIQDITVVTRTDKKTGRGGKVPWSPPLKSEATKRGLELYQIDTFTGWTPPPTDLVVAVSFGLLVPARILNASTYGGINVHPSLLPDLRGAAPVHWAIMLGRKHTGVTIQTLHPTKFDEGVILDQTPPPGIPVNHRQSGLTDTLAAFGAEMLINAIRRRIYVPPYQTLQPRNFDEVSLAPKIASEHRLLDFDALTAEDILRRKNALSSLFAFALNARHARIRITIHESFHEFSVDSPDIHDICRWQPTGQPFAIEDSRGNILGNGGLLVRTVDGKTLCMPKITVDGSPTMTSFDAARKSGLIKPFVQRMGLQNYRVAWFHGPLSTNLSESQQLGF